MHLYRFDYHITDFVEVTLIYNILLSYQIQYILLGNGSIFLFTQLCWRKTCMLFYVFPEKRKAWKVHFMA